MKVALLTPYDGGNLGDAAIQEALIANLRQYDPRVHLYGITLHPESTAARHGIPCYPLAGDLPSVLQRKEGTRGLSQQLRCNVAHRKKRRNARTFCAS